MTQEALKTITVEGVEYAIDTLPQGIRNAVELYQKFQGQLADQQAESLKTQLALQTIASQISEAVKQHAAEQPAEDTTEGVQDVEAK